MASAFGPAADDTDVHPDAERMRILILDDQVEKATDDALAMGFHVHKEGNPPPSEGPTGQDRRDLAHDLLWEEPAVTDYKALNKEFAQQKAALTRATKKPEGLERRAAVIEACKKAVAAWNDHFDGWPDDWARWQRALDDVTPPYAHAPRLEELT